MAGKIAVILDFTKNSNLPGKCENCKYFFSRVVQCDRIKHFAAFGSILYVVSSKNGEKHAFLFKNG